MTFFNTAFPILIHLFTFFHSWCCVASVPMRPATLACGRAGACCACSRCWMGGLILFFFILSVLSSFSNASSLGRRLDILKYCGLDLYYPSVVFSYYGDVLAKSWWLGWAMVLGSFQCWVVLLLLHIVGQGPAVLAAGAGWVGYMFYIFHLSFIFNVLSFWETAGHV